MINQQISDLAERKLALDPTKSFIVQAPAGSGKTTLLVERYLTLLSKVNNPEEITAITFTRKAALEMRYRIISTLKKSAENIAPQNQYEAKMLNIAQMALKQNQIKKWNIIQNPNRLRIQTIDAFCYYLVNQAPILAKINKSYQILQNQETEAYLGKAARALLENIDDPQYSNHLERLLLHLHNDWELAENLFITMLKSREQWLPHIVGLKNIQELRQKMEEALQEISQENGEHCLALFPKQLLQDLMELLEFSRSNLQRSDPCFVRSTPFSPTPSLLQKAAEILLTKDFSWRKKVTKEQGFPAPNSQHSQGEQQLFRSMKNRLETLLTELGKHESLRLSLKNLLLSPLPHYSNEQWEIIETLLELLPLLAAQLKVIFDENLVADHAEISMAALRTLGDQDSPSDLALNLDYRLQHLLIDEFQDTSIAHYELLEKLITTWQPNDGRTIFIVGDPMQSIYRFREAEVGLFLRAEHEGIANLKLQPLILTTNFRSSQNIIHWINNNFSRILPLLPDIGFGAVPFRPATAIANNPGSSVNVALLKDADEITEANQVISMIQKILAQTPDDSIAILVKARKHLQKIITALRQANLNYQALELETLQESIVIRDLFSLTCALADLTDRIAWIAVLRAPWCGLNLADLHQVANGKEQIIWDNICNLQNLVLSRDGKERLTKFKLALAPLFLQRERLPWRELIEKTWWALGGPATVTNEAELTHAEVYFELLENNQFDINTLEKKLDSLFIPPTPQTKIQIMTIHKAKGLEFDHVIIPGINRHPRQDENKLLLWLERPKLHHGSSLLLAPIAASGNNADHVYQYLQLVEQKKIFYETGRLLYVAITRAKKSTHLVGSVKSHKEKTIMNNIHTGSLLEQLNPCFDESWVTEKSPEAATTLVPTNERPHGILRFKSEWRLPISIQMPPSNNNPDWEFFDNQKTIIGTVIHHCLCQISEGDLNVWNDNYIVAQQPYWRKLLQQSGCLNIDDSLKLINEAIKLTLQDKRGHWILTSHKKAMSELALTTKINNRFEHYIIDRTFIDENDIRWIIDYKTSEPTTKNIGEFLAKEAARYSKQLGQYAQIMQGLEPTQTIKLGLYFPLFSGWIEIKA